MRRAFALALAVAAPLVAGRVTADEPCPCPEKKTPPPVTGSLGAGLSITGGNTDSTSFNFTTDLAWDPKTGNVVKLNGLWLYGSQNGVASVDKTTFTLRDEYSISSRLYAYGEVGYLRDRFKSLTYLISPSVGAGYKVVKTETITLAFDGGVGGAFEKDTGLSASSSAALRAGESFAWKISSVATFTQNAWGLWKTNDFQDYFLHFDAGLAASITKRTEIRLSFIDDYKNKPPEGLALKKNDTAFIATFVFKI